MWKTEFPNTIFPIIPVTSWHPLDQHWVYCSVYCRQCHSHCTQMRGMLLSRAHPRGWGGAARL